MSSPSRDTGDEQSLTACENQARKVPVLIGSSLRATTSEVSDRFQTENVEELTKTRRSTRCMMKRASGMTRSGDKEEGGKREGSSTLRRTRQEVDEEVGRRRAGSTGPPSK